MWDTVDEGGTVTIHESEDLVAKGVAALENDHTHLALVCFERASEIEMSPTVCSGLGYCVAAARGEVEKGMQLCRDAIERDPGNAFHYRNLGSVLLLAGNRGEAIQVLRDGLRIRKDDGIIRKLDTLGTRKPPVIKSLARSHFLNRLLGSILSRLGFR
jgi:tetratricopeptide (TPR) repeat protein